MFRNALFLLCALVVSSTLTPLRAGLAWENKDQTVTHHPGDIELHIDFPFTNTGGKPVIISSIQASCGCTTASLPKSSYQPGEKDVLHATFEVGSRAGIYKVGIKVLYVDGTSDTLSFQTNIQTAYTIEPTILLWPKGSQPVPRTAKVTYNNKSVEFNGISVRLATSFQFKYSPTPTGFNLEVTPISTKTEYNIPLILDFTVEGKHQSTLVYLSIKG